MHTILHYEVAVAVVAIRKVLLSDHGKLRKSGIQSKFLYAALQKTCQTQAELAHTND